MKGPCVLIWDLSPLILGGMHGAVLNVQWKLQQQQKENKLIVAYRVFIGMFPAVTPLLSIADLQQQAIWQLHALCCLLPLPPGHTPLAGKLTAHTNTIQLYFF